MGFNEVRVNKDREDREVEELVDGLIQRSEFNPICLAPPLFAGLQKLIHGQINDYEQTIRERDLSPEMFRTECDKEDYVERLSQSAWRHFNNHYQEKMRLSLIEMILESLAFAHPIFLQSCGKSETEVNEARPPLADLQQNVLRRSILWLESLPYRKREGVDREQSNNSLSPVTRTAAEIYTHMALWTYDHIRVVELLKEQLLPSVAKHSEPDNEALFYANEAAEFIWDNINGAMQQMTNILVICSLMLAKSSASQRFVEVPASERRKAQVSAKKLEKIARPLLRLWFESLSVKLSRAGRPPVDERDQSIEREQFKSKVINKMICVLEEPEKISQWRVAKLLGIGNWRNKTDRSLYNHLKSLNLEWNSLRAEARRIHQKKRTKN